MSLDDMQSSAWNHSGPQQVCPMYFKLLWGRVVMAALGAAEGFFVYRSGRILILHLH